MIQPWPYQRGFAAIGLHNPKSPGNIGGALRAAHCYGAKLVVVAGNRHEKRAIRDPMNTPDAWKQIPTIATDDVFNHLPYDCVPVAVDLVDDATALPSFQHPARAFYIFGPEDGTLGKAVLDRCALRVMIPTVNCMNLAATVNVVLYDRIAKAMRSAHVVSKSKVA